MKPLPATAARAALAQAQADVVFYQKQIERIEKNCLHTWTEVKYEPIEHKAYTIPGDPPGTMGVDRQLPTHVPAKTEDRWTRQCKICGKHEETRKSQSQIYTKTSPQF